VNNLLGSFFYAGQHCIHWLLGLPRKKGKSANHKELHSTSRKKPHSKIVKSFTQKLLWVSLKNIAKNFTIKISQNVPLNKSLRVSKKIAKSFTQKHCKELHIKFAHYTNNYSNFETILLITEFNFEWNKT